jgi:uncharacterized protein (DUF2267 family)
VTYDEFVHKVRELTGLRRPEAERAIDATLRTLAERISHGEAEDLAQELDRPLREPLLSASPPKPPAFPVDEFIRRVAVREFATEAEATEHARAVLAVLRMAVSDKEWHDTLAQLPADYDEILGQPTTR